MPTDDEQNEKLYTGPERRAQPLEVAAGELNRNVTALTGSVRQLASYSKRSRQLIYWTIAGLLLDLLLTVLVVVLFDNQHETNAKVRAQQAQVEAALHSDCPFFRDLATLPLSPQATKTGFLIVADSRIAYVSHDCVAKLGKLPPADPRVLPYLPPEAR
jgi:hypothetical protein